MNDARKEYIVQQAHAVFIERLGIPQPDNDHDCVHASLMSLRHAVDSAVEMVSANG